MRHIAERDQSKNMKQKLRQALSSRLKKPITDPGRILSAVLVPLYYKEGQYHILLIKRTEKVTKHRGEISFPGGGCEKSDKTRLDTALRESAEEIGLMADDVEVLGELDDVVSVKTNYIISPFVGFIPWPYQFRVDGYETEAIIEVPIPVLLENNYSHQELRDGKPVTSYFYNYEGRIIWGATARILNEFLEIFTRII